jgi:hypothetical protein
MVYNTQNYWLFWTWSILFSTGETGGLLAARLPEHTHNLKEGFLEKWKSAQHAYEEGHRVGWDDTKIL